MDYQVLAEYTQIKNRFMTANGIVVSEVGPERAVTKLTIGPESLNANGNLHGGAIFTLADAAAGLLSRADGRRYVTESADIHYLRGCSSGTVIGTATLIRRGGRSCVIQVEIAHEDGELLATVTTHFTCVGESWK